jgi:inorganic pyrophosphatase
MFQGLQISVENPAGSTREWYDEHADENGETKMLIPYGYIRGTMGLDGDAVDVFVGPDQTSEKVYVIQQLKKVGKDKFEGLDEQKVMLGFASSKAAKTAYLKHYNSPEFFGGMKQYPMDKFKEKLAETKGEVIKSKMSEGGYTTKEASRVASLLGADLTSLGISISEFTAGLNEEREHKDVTKDQAEKTGKIAIAHLKEDPKYYSKLKTVMKALNARLSSDILVQGNTMLILSKSKAAQSFASSKEPAATGSDEKLAKSLRAEANAALAKACKTLEAVAAEDDDAEDIDKAENTKYQSKKQIQAINYLVKEGKVKPGVKAKLDAGTSAERRKDLPRSKNKPSKYAEKSMEDVSKALTALAVSGLSRRARMDAAFNLGRSAGANSSQRIPTEYLEVPQGLGTQKLRPAHEPPVVPVRHVDAPSALVVAKSDYESCSAHGYLHKSDRACPMCEKANFGEAGPRWKR